ncbi:FHA domain-containing protein [Planctomycetota bacterium]
MTEIRIQGTDYILQPGITVVGRGKDADIEIGSGGLSRMHARFIIEDEMLSIEDLGSKNGTFVNGKRIEGRRELIGGDTLRLANMECQIKPPETAPKPPVAPPSKPAPAAPSPARAEKAAQAASRKDKDMIKKLVGIGILAALVFVGYVIVSGYEAPELLKARELIAHAETELDDITVSSNREDNLEILDALHTLKSELVAISPEFAEEHKRAKACLRELVSHVKALKARNKALEAIIKAEREMTDILVAYRAGSMQASHAVTALERLILQYPDSPAAAKAPVEIKAIQDALVEAERELIAAAHNEANSQWNAQKYQQAVVTIDTALAREYRHTGVKERENLRNLRETIIKTAEAKFKALAEDAVSRAGTGDCEALKKKLQRDFEILGFDHFRNVLSESLTSIDRIKTERIAAARARLKKDLAAIEKSEQKRAYGAAFTAYEGLLGRIEEPELKKEVEQRIKIMVLLKAGKAHIIRFITAAGGVEVVGIGFISKVTEENLEIEEDGAAMPITWDRIRDGEFIGLLRKALGTSAPAEALTACGYLLLEKNKAADAEPLLTKALGQKPGIAQEYPFLFEALKARIAQRQEEDAALAAARAKEREERMKRQKISATPFTGGWEPTGLSGGGAMYTPAISRLDPNLMFINCDMSGSYVSKDGGKTWKMNHHRQRSSNTRCKPAFHPKDPNIIYAPTGYGGTSVAITKDCGETWQQHGTVGAGMAGELIVDPENPSLMVTGTANGASISTSEGKTWSACSGVSGKGVNAYIDRTSPVNNRIIFAATSQGIWRSDDHGKSWNKRTNGLPSQEILCMAGSSDPKTRIIMLYCSVPSRAGGKDMTGGVYSSRDRGETWQQAMGKGINKDTKAADQYGQGPLAQYPVVLTTDVKPLTVYAMNTSTGFWPPHHPTVFRSDDGGKNWRATLYMGVRFSGKYNVAPNYHTAGSGQSYQEGVGNGAICPTNPDIVLRLGGMRVFITDNGGESWFNGHTQMAPGETKASPESSFVCNGLVVTSTWNYYVDPFDHKRHYIAYTDIGFAHSKDSGQTWTWWSTKNAVPWRNTCYELVFDPDIAGKAWGAFSNVHDIPNGNIILDRHWAGNPERGPGGVGLTTDHCIGWKVQTSGLPDSPACSIVLDPKTPKNQRTLYVAVFGKGVYKSTDDGKTWVNKSKGLGSSANMRLYRLVLHADGSLFALITARRSGGRFTTEGVGIYRSTDGAESWEHISAATGWTWPKDFNVHPTNSNTILVGVSDGGNDKGGLYRTTDGGAHWQMVTRKHREHFGAFFHPRKPDWIYMTLAEGCREAPLYLSTDGGSSWKPFLNFPFSNVQRVAFDPDDDRIIYVLTFGGSVFRGPATPGE